MSSSSAPPGTVALKDLYWSTKSYQLHPIVELFTGKDWEECDRFIRSIRAHALWEGKQRDSAWMADFAAPLFSHKALSWHCRLPEDVRQDWSKLEIALLDQWPLLEDDEESEIASTPAATLPLNLNNKVEPPSKGTLRIVLDGSDTKYYVGFTYGVCDLTTHVDTAIRVRAWISSGATLLERIDHSSPSWLAIQWTSPKPKIGDGSSDWAYLVAVDSLSLRSSLGRSFPLQLAIHTFSDNGEVALVWRKDNETDIRLFAMIINTDLHLVPNMSAFASDNRKAKRGRIFIEPTD